MSIAWSHDGNRLASGSEDKTVKIWDLATGQCTKTLHSSHFRFLKFGQVNINHLQYLAGTLDIDSIELWDTATETVWAWLE